MSISIEPTRHAPVPPQLNSNPSEPCGLDDLLEAGVAESGGTRYRLRRTPWRAGRLGRVVSRESFADPDSVELLIPIDLRRVWPVSNHFSSDRTHRKADGLMFADYERVDLRVGVQTADSPARANYDLTAWAVRLPHAESVPLVAEADGARNPASILTLAGFERALIALIDHLRRNVESGDKAAPIRLEGGAIWVWHDGLCLMDHGAFVSDEDSPESATRMRNYAAGVRDLMAEYFEAWARLNGIADGFAACAPAGFWEGMDDLNSIGAAVRGGRMRFDPVRMSWSRRLMRMGEVVRTQVGKYPEERFDFSPLPPNAEVDVAKQLETAMGVLRVEPLQIPGAELDPDGTLGVVEKTLRSATERWLRIRPLVWQLRRVLESTNNRFLASTAQLSRSLAATTRAEQEIVTQRANATSLTGQLQAEQQRSKSLADRNAVCERESRQLAARNVELERQTAASRQEAESARGEIAPLRASLKEAEQSRAVWGRDVQLLRERDRRSNVELLGVVGEIRQTLPAPLSARLIGLQIDLLAVAAFFSLLAYLIAGSVPHATASGFRMGEKSVGWLGGVALTLFGLACLSAVSPGRRLAGVHPVRIRRDGAPVPLDLVGCLGVAMLNYGPLLFLLAGSSFAPSLGSLEPDNIVVRLLSPLGLVTQSDYFAALAGVWLAAVAGFVLVRQIDNAESWRRSSTPAEWLMGVGLCRVSLEGLTRLTALMERLDTDRSATS